MSTQDADTSWAAAPSDLTLDHGQVHLWRVVLDAPRDVLDRLRATLTARETAQADRFASREHRRWFVVRRGALRAILARYLHTAPGDVNFTFGHHGKPALVHDSDGQLQFNLSDSGPLAVIAVTQGRAIGVDIEHVRPGRAEEAIARRFFSTAECDALASLPAGQRQAAFFDCWTRKEAYIKARGEGLALPLDCFQVSIKPGQPAALLHSNEGPAETQRWAMRAIHPAHGFAGCLAVEGNGWQLHCWDWSC